MVELILTLLISVLAIAGSIYKNRTSKEAKRQGEKEDVDKALATNDFSYLSDDLNDKRKRMRKKNLLRRSGR